MTPRRCVNLARLFAHLVYEDALSLVTLKVRTYALVGHVWQSLIRIRRVGLPLQVVDFPRLHPRGLLFFHAFFSALLFGFQSSSGRLANTAPPPAPKLGEVTKGKGGGKGKGPAAQASLCPESAKDAHTRHIQVAFSKLAVRVRCRLFRIAVFAAASHLISHAVSVFRDVGRAKTLRRTE